MQEELIQDVAKLRSLGGLLAPTPAFVISLFYGFFIFLFLKTVQWLIHTGDVSCGADLISTRTVIRFGGGALERVGSAVDHVHESVPMSAKLSSSQNVSDTRVNTL